MTLDLDRINDAVAQLRRQVPLDLGRRGPVPLAGYYAETGLDHVELPGLTRGAVADYLQREGIPADDLGDPADVLAGFVLAAGQSRMGFRQRRRPAASAALHGGPRTRAFRPSPRDDGPVPGGYGCDASRSRR